MNHGGFALWLEKLLDSHPTISSLVLAVFLKKQKFVFLNSESSSVTNLYLILFVLWFNRPSASKLFVLRSSMSSTGNPSWRTDQPNRIWCGTNRHLIPHGMLRGKLWITLHVPCSQDLYTELFFFFLRGQPLLFLDQGKFIHQMKTCSLWNISRILKYFCLIKKKHLKKKNHPECHCWKMVCFPSIFN